MLRDYDKYYGCAFSRLIDRIEVGIAVRRLPERSQGFYLIEGTLPIVLKYSKSRRGPWTFSFGSEQLRDYCAVHEEYRLCVVAFVCGGDGIAALDDDQFSAVLDVHSKAQEAVSIRRRLKEMYSVGGSQGVLPEKISRDSLFESVQKLLG